jgi:hypothetical protein
MSDKFPIYVLTVEEEISHAELIIPTTVLNNHDHRVASKFSFQIMHFDLYKYLASIPLTILNSKKSPWKRNFPEYSQPNCVLQHTQIVNCTTNSGETFKFVIFTKHQ